MQRKACTEIPESMHSMTVQYALIHRYLQNIWRELKQLAVSAGVETEKVFPHNFRHMFARIFYRVTGNLLQLADILGHSSIEVTRIYASDGIMEWKKSMEMLEMLVE